MALGKTALQSSSMSHELQSGSKDEKVVIPGVGPELAVDGDMSTVPSADSCSLTAFEVDPWWRVDLQSEHIVTDVNVVSSSGMFYKLGCRHLSFRMFAPKLFPRADFLNAPNTDQDQLLAKKPKIDRHHARFRVNTSKLTTIILTVRATSMKFRSCMTGENRINASRLKVTYFFRALQNQI